MSAVLSVLGLLTVIDIIRKKLRLFGLWIAVVALLFVPIPIFGVRVVLPVGIAIYWCERKKLLKKRNQIESGL